MKRINQWPHAQVDWATKLTAIRAWCADPWVQGEIVLTDKYLGWRGWLSTPGSPFDVRRYYVIPLEYVRSVEVTGYDWISGGYLRFIWRDQNSGEEGSYSFSPACPFAVIDRVRELGIPVIGKDKKNL